MRSPGRTAIVLVATLVGVATWAVALPTAPAATFVVDTLGDAPADGDTLREAIALANGAAGPDVITFAPGVSGTIVLEAGPRVEKEEFENDEWANFVKISWLDNRTTSGSWRAA
jgi:hypothetical protein